jgi:DNA-binding transcriptional MerR regulator
MNFESKNLWQTKRFAELSKVTVRTLHHYDRIGLLKPKHYDRNGFRLYGDAEFARLQQITTLKFIGFSLNQIREILKEQEFDLAETLGLQKKILRAQRDRLNLALEAITRAEQAFTEKGATDWESFNEILEVINMEQNMDWTKKYYTETAQAKIEERKSLWSPELQERVTRDWNELTRDVEAAIADGVSPGEERAQELAERWNALINEFTGGDPEIREGLNKMYADEAGWQDKVSWKKPYGDEVQNFIAEAVKCNSKA